MVKIEEMLVGTLAYGIVFYDEDYNEYFISYIAVSNGKIDVEYLPFKDDQSFAENVHIIDRLETAIALTRAIEYKLKEKIPSLNLKIKCFKHFKFPDEFYLVQLFEIKLKGLKALRNITEDKIYYDAIGNSVAKRFDTLDDAIEYLLLTVSDENMDGITIYEDILLEEEYEFREQ